MNHVSEPSFGSSCRVVRLGVFGLLNFVFGLLLLVIVCLGKAFTIHIHGGLPTSKVEVDLALQVGVTRSTVGEALKAHQFHQTLYPLEEISDVDARWFPISRKANDPKVPRVGNVMTDRRLGTTKASVVIVQALLGIAFEQLPRAATIFAVDYIVEVLFAEYEDCNPRSCLCSL